MTKMGHRLRSIGAGVGLAGLICGLLPVSSADAQVSEARIAFSIRPGPLQTALLRYADITGVQLLYSTEMVAGRQATRVVGDYTPDAALDLLLRGTGLLARRVGAGVIVLQPDTAPAEGAARLRRRTAAEASDRPQAFSQAGSAEQNPNPRELATNGALSASEADATTAPPEIVVTGTHIRGSNPGAPPVITITRADMERNGYATVAQALQALPATFGGTATEQSALAFADRSSSNPSFATGVDLRGLGAGATLVLVNGRRVAGTGSLGAFSDVSAIPTGAVDRVEVLLDGASAIYGSDAVGGVVNIILKRHFQGFESRVRFGSVTSGGKRDIQLDQTAGKQWATGGVMLSYEYDRQGALASADRGFAASADSRPYGGTDHRYYFSLPGNVLGFDSAGDFAPTYAIPAGQNGTGLTPTSFLPGVVNLENFREGIDLIPRQTRHSVYATLTQDIGDNLQFLGDVRYSHRAYSAASLGSSTILDVTNANPYFVSPDGATSDLIAYSFGQELGPIHLHGTDEALAVSGGLDADLGSDWKLRSYAAFSQEREYSRSDNFENDALLAEALGNTPDDPTTAFDTATDGFFNPYGTGSSNSATILEFIGSAYTVGTVRTQVLTGHVDADGTLFILPGGPVKLAVGGDIRRETFRSGGIDFYATTTPVAEPTVSGARVVEAAFAELHVPIVGAGNRVPLIRTFALSLAGRVEHYDDFGTTANPKVGLTWVPIAGLSLRTSYGTSFRAPSLRELKAQQALATTSLPLVDGSSINVIQLSGGNPGLKPETARSWTAGADLHPVALPGLTLSGTWFRTIFTRRIGSPVSEDFANALIDPALAPFVDFVSPATNAADLARVSALLADPTLAGGSTLPPTSIGAIVDSRYVNTGRVDVSGIDFNAAYSWTTGGNHFDLTATGSYLLHYREQVTQTSVAVEQRNLAGYPVAFKGRLSAGWTRGALNALLGMDYVNRYHDLAGNRINAWTTFDLQLGYRATAHSGWTNGLEISLAVQNLFDRSPPFYDSVVGAGYDAANADALKRFVALQLTKRW